MASLRKHGRIWYIRFYDHDGEQREVRGCADKRATELMANALEAEAGRVRSGLSTPGDEARRKHEARSLNDHLADWHQALLDRGNTTKHAALYLDRARRVAGLAGLKKLSDLNAGNVQGALAALRGEGRSLATLNHHRGAIRSFSRWAWKNGRLRDDPLISVAGFNAREDRRHDRRTISLEEVRLLIEAAHSGPKFRGMTGLARALCYRLAIGTGLRYSELASLTPEAFDFGSSPSVTVAASYTKNGEKATLPVPRDLAEDLGRFVASVDDGENVFRLPKDLGAKMLRIDLKAAGIPYRDEAGLVFDFHSLRCQCATLLDSANVAPRVVQRLMRHSTLDLTSRYTRPTLHALESASNTIPTLKPDGTTTEALSATGTDGGTKINASVLSLVFPLEGTGNGRDVSVADVSMKEDDPPSMGRNSLGSSGVNATGRVVSGVVGSSGVRDRTGDLRVMNPPPIRGKIPFSKGLHRPGKDVSLHFPSDNRKTDPELASVIAVWDQLPPPIRAAVLAMVRAADL